MNSAGDVCVGGEPFGFASGVREDQAVFHRDVGVDLGEAGDELLDGLAGEKSKENLAKPFSPSRVNQMLVALARNGLVYKNRHGRYSFAVPLLGGFIKRQREEGLI